MAALSAALIINVRVAIIAIVLFNFALWCQKVLSIVMTFR